MEDNPEVSEVAVAMLQQLGHRVRVAGNAADALAEIQAGETPDLVFSDIVMAGEIDGVGLARHLRREHPELPLLLATGYAQTAEQLGLEFPILRKPYTLADLERSIDAALARAAGAAGGKLVPIGRGRRARKGG